MSLGRSYRSAAFWPVAFCCAVIYALGQGLAAAEEGEVGPVEQHCIDRGGNLYDCACIASHEPQLRQQLNDEAYEEQLEGISALEVEIERIEAAQAEETEEQQIANFQRVIDNLKNRMEPLRERPDPASIRASDIMREFFDNAEGNECRSREGAYNQAFEGCEATKRADAREGYCDCVASSTAEEWVSSNLANKMSSFRNAVVRAGSACR